MPTGQGRTGRPTKLDQILNQDTGETTADRIVALVKAGNYIETAAQAAGINKTTLYDWMKQGARLSQDIAEGRQTRSDLSKKQRSLVDFSNAVAEAMAFSEVQDVTQLARLASGGILQQIETIKVDGDGNVVEQTTRSERSAPHAQTIQWRLERRHPTKWGRKQAIEHSGPGGGAIPVEVQVEQMRDLLVGVLDDLGIALTDEVRHVVAGRLRQMGAASRQQAIEAQSTPVAP